MFSLVKGKVTQWNQRYSQQRRQTTQTQSPLHTYKKKKRKPIENWKKENRMRISKLKYGENLRNR